MSPSVFVVEDDRAFTDALVLTLESAGLRVETYGAAEEFLAAYRGDAPGCLVTDVRMPYMSGLELQQHLIERRIRIPVVFITGHGDVAMSVTALKRGAVDFLEKPFTATALLQSVADALARDERMRQIEEERGIVQTRYAQLTEREALVMTMVTANRSNKEIARALNISPRTVDHHREHLMAKMHARSLHDLIVMGLLCGVHELRLNTEASSAE